MNTHPLAELKQYTQKSLLFLYPLLQISNDVIKPINTYMSIKKVKRLPKLKLICEYDINTEGLNVYLKELQKLKTYLLDFTAKQKRYVIFDMSNMPVTYTKILKGNYSTLSPNAKIVVTLNQQPLVTRAVYPEYFIEEYSSYFKTNIENIGPELLDKPNIKKETLSLNNNELEQLNKFIEACSLVQ